MAQVARKLQGPLAVRSWNVARLFGGEVRYPVAGARHSRKMRRLAQLAEGTDTSSQDGSSPGRWLMTVHPEALSSALRRASGQSTRLRRSSRWCVGGSGFCDSAVPRCRGLISPVCTSSPSSAAPPRTLRAVRRALLPLTEASIGEIRFSRSLEAEHFLDLFAEFSEVLLDGFSRRKFREGELQQLASTTSLPTPPSKSLCPAGATPNA